MRPAENIETYTAWNNWQSLFIIAALLIVIGGLGVGFSFGTANTVTIFIRSSIPLLIGVALAVVGVKFGRVKIVTDQNGIEVISRKSKVRLDWDAVESVHFLKIMSGLPVRQTDAHLMIAGGGTMLRFASGSGILVNKKKCGKIADTAHKMTSALLLQRAVDNYMQKKEVRFGQIVVAPDGIKADNTILTWVDFKSIKVGNNGYVDILSNKAAKPWRSIPIRAVHNLAILAPFFSRIAKA